LKFLLLVELIALPMLIRCSIIVALLLGRYAPAQAEQELSTSFREFFGQHCLECHSGNEAEMGFDLEALSSDLNDAETMRRWVLIYDRVVAGEMPPEGEELADAQRNQFKVQLGRWLTEADAERREVVLRRLNRVEFENTLVDLFELDHLDIKDMLPEDTQGFGFDNNGEALALSTEQMLAYLEALEVTLDQVVGIDERPVTNRRAIDLKRSSERVLGKLFREEPDGVVLFSSEYSPSVFKGFDIDSPGVYRFKIQARAVSTQNALTLRVYAGDVNVGRRDRWLSGFYDIAPGDNWTEIEFEERLQPLDSIKVMTYRNGGHETQAATTTRPGILVGLAECEGPLIESWPPRSRTVLLGDIDPANATLEDAIVVLGRLLPKAFRREVSPGELVPYVQLTRDSLADGQSWLHAVRTGIKGMLISPEFLYLEESSGVRISDHQFAARMSYFLWRSQPDQRLRELAAEGALTQPEVLDTQLQRMLNDNRTQRFLDDFANQWLDLNNIDFTEPDKQLFPEYDDVLRASMLTESRGFMTEMFRANHAVSEFIDSDWSILNSRLAEHYAIDGVAGLHYRRVQLPDESPRGGVFTQAAVLKVTANGTNTSPVQRGAWMLENILGGAVPPPPAGVPAIEPDITGAHTIRQQLDLHRNIPSCAGCHNRIDPPGFALERFDPIGGWRDWYRTTGAGEPVSGRYTDSPINKNRVRYRRGLDVDAGGRFATGEAFDDFREFKRLVSADAQATAYNMVNKLLSFALGREMGFSDRSAMRAIVANAAESNYGFRTLISEIVRHEIFRRP
jgi:hypothetical protein